MSRYEDLKNKRNSRTEEEKEQTSTSRFQRIKANRGERNYGVDDSFITAFIQDAQNFLQTSSEEHNGLTWQSGTDTSKNRSREETWSDLNSRSAVIRAHLNANRDKMDEATYNELTSYLDTLKSANAEVFHSFRNAEKHYSQWDTEESYNSWYASQKDKEQKLSDDLTARQMELEELVGVQEEYNSRVETLKKFYLTNDYTFVSKEDVDEALAYTKTAEEKYGISADNTIDNIIQNKKLYLRDAQRLQEGAKLASVSGNADFADYSGYSSTKADGVWDKLTSQYGMGYDDLTYEYINNQNGIRDEIKRKYVSMKGDSNFGDGESIFEEKGYDYLTEDEIAIYNYHYAKEGKDAAQKYLDNIQETLNARKAGKMYANMEDKNLLELAFGVVSGLDQFESGAKGAWNAITGNDEYIPASATQMASGMVREDLADETLPVWYNFKKGQWEDQVFGRSVGQAAYDTITTTANMAPSVMTSWALSMVNPVAGSAWVTAGQIAGTGMMGASAAGNAYQEVINLGYDKDQARAYAGLVGASEAGLQYLLGGIGNLGGKLSGNVVTKIMNGVDNAFARTAIKLGGNMLSEGLEEGLQEILTPWFQNLVLHTENDVDWNEVAYSSLLGALTAGFMEGGSTIAGEVNTYRTGKNLQAADISAQRLADIGKTFSADTVAYQLAGRVNENTGAYTMGRLFNEIGATLSEQNVTEITNALVEKGMDEVTARKNAEALAYVVEGGQLSERQVAAIEANEVLAEASRTTLIDANTTWNQRSQGYNEMLKALADEMASPKASRTKQAQQGTENAPATDTVDGQTKNVTESISEAENVDTSPAKVRNISSIDNGQVTIKLEDDSDVSLKDADLDPDDGVRIETITSIDGISATDASFIFNTLRTSTGASAQMDSLGAKEAYKYGFYGFSQDHMTKHGVFANSLTHAQRQAIYETGKNARQKQIETATPKKAKTKEKGIYFDHGNGNVETFKDADKILLAEEKRSAGVRAAVILNKLGIGGDIYFFESYRNSKGQLVYKDSKGMEVKAPNGWYSPGDGSIHIDLNAGNKGNGLVLFTLAHELTHFIEEWSPQKYKILADFLIENYEKGQSMDKLVRAKQDKLSAQRGKRISYKEAYSEVIADSMEAMLADGNVMEKLMELKAKDNSLFMKMKQFFDNLLAKIRNVYNGLTSDSTEGQAILEMKDSIEKIQQLFAEALVDASENFNAAEVQKNTTDDGGVMYSLKYNDAIDQLHAGTLDRTMNTHLKVLDNTPQVYIDKAGAKDLKIIMGWDIAYLAMNKSGYLLGNYHGLGPEVMKAIPQALQDPLYIVKQDNGRIIAVTEVVVKGNRSTLVSIELDAFKSTTQDGESESENYNLIVTIFDAKANYLQKLMNNGEIVHNKNNEDPAHFILRLKSLNKALPDDDRAKSSNKDIAHDTEDVKNKSTEAIDLNVDEKTGSVAPSVLMSERTWTESDYVQERDTAAKEIAKAIGVSVKKAKAYIDSVNSIAKMIADDRVRLDYFSSPGRSSFVSNVEYGGSFDFSTLCKKRRLLTGTFTAIQKALPNTALTADEILDIRNRMKDAGLEVSCGLCYVEGSRANMGQFAKEFLKLYKQYYPDAWQPNMADVNTPDGIEWVRINHPECYEQYEYFWNHYGTLKPGDKNLFASQQKPKLYQLHTEYKGEILDKFNDDDNVEEKNLNGGIRLQSFSDFEIVHLIDTMQIIMDMSRVGLAGQAYTKVPDFAWALGDTGLKINLSLIAKDVDENGRLIFDDVEGMPIDTAVELRNRYSKNVGTILVAFNDEQLLAAMADERVDFIIPFHRSQWKKSQYGAMGLPAKTKDYTYMQNEKYIKPQYHEYRGRLVKDKASNYMPNEYWDFSKSGKDNAEAYLEMCARNNKRPKFYKLLQNNGDGSYSLKADGSTDGYWKLLIDFKMYDNDGVGSPQMPVKPEFNMDEATRMLNDYSGGHSNFPVAQGIVDDFVQEYKDSHKGVQYSDRDSAGHQLGEDQVEYFERSMVRDRNGNLQVVYHGGTVEYEFDTTRGGKGDTQYGPGSYFTDSEYYAKEYTWYRGGNVRAYYLNIEKMFDDTNMDMTAQSPEWQKLEQILRSNGIEDKFIERFKNAGFAYMSRYLAIKAGAKTSSSWEGSEKLNTMLREAGFQGIKGYLNDSYQYVIFTPNQAKLTTNEVPSTFYDTRYQDRDSDSVSNRSLLANALEGAVKNGDERNLLRNYKTNLSLINAEEQKLHELNQQIKELSFAKGPRDTKKINDLRFEAKQTASRINSYDRELLKIESMQPIKDVLAREKKMAYKRAEQRGKEALADYKAKVEAQQKETTEKWRESRKAAVAKARETAEKRDARVKLQKLVLETVKWISYPAKTDVKCPDILKKPYESFLQGIDLSSKRLANGGEATKNDLRLANAMDSLATAIDKVMLSQDPSQDVDKVLDIGYLDLPADFVQKIRDMTESIKSMMVEGEYVVNTMTAEEVRKLSQMIRTLNHAIKTMSNLYANLRFANVEALGFDTMDFLDAVGEIDKTGGMKDFVQWDNALPYYAFKRFGKGGESIFEGLMDAQDKLAFLAQEIFDFQEKTWTGKEAKSWSEDTHTIALPNGNELTLTTADAMSIYCLSRREQALPHLLGGGVRVMGIQKGSQKAKDSRSLLTIEDVDAIISSLTDRQKQVAEAMQEYMSTVCSEWGNEISMKRFLTREFTEKFYFPIESNDENLTVKDPAAQQSDLFRLLNISATKPLTQGANNEVIIRNIFDVFVGHTSDMARLNAYGMGLLDYMKWLNYREKTTNEAGQINVKGVRKSMETAYGKAANRYVLNLIKDVNGRASDGGDPNILMKWMRAAKTAAVGNSVRVAALQITAYPRARLVLSSKSLALGLTKVPNIGRAKKYCGIALWKSFGFYDTNISRSIEDQMKGVTDVKQKLIELSLKGAELGDAITWGALWNACEYEVAKTTKNKVGSDEFYQEVGKKLREVVYRTQVVDSTLTRSQIMRSKSGMAQEAAAFMSEPTLSANILMDAGFEFVLEKRRTGSVKAAWKKTGSYIGGAVAIHFIGQLTTALVESIWDAWRDDDDEEFGEKYWDAFVENLVLDLIPFNKIPIVSDVFEAVLSMFGVGFYSSDKMSTTWLTQAVSAVDAWKKVFSDDPSATVYNALYKSVRALSSYYGVSFSGLMREGVALWNNTAGAYDATLKILTYDRSKEELGDMLLDAFIEGSGRQAESLKAEFRDEGEYKSAIRTAVKNRYETGDIDADTAERYLVDHSGLEEDDAYWKVQEWSYENKHDDDFKKYNNFYEAVQSGKNLKAVIKEYTDNGVESKTLASQITTYFKPLYKGMTNTERAAIKGYLLNAYVLLGYDRRKKTKDIDKWAED